jgi:hypothetical protein
MWEFVRSAVAIRWQRLRNATLPYSLRTGKFLRRKKILPLKLCRHRDSKSHLAEFTTLFR